MKVTEWSGDNLVLVFFLATSSVEFIVMVLYPMLIHPLTSKMKPLPKDGILHEEIERMVKSMFKGSKYDVPPIFI